MNAEGYSPATALKRIEAEIAVGRLSVYRNLVDQPYVRFPLTARSKGEADSHRQLFDEDFRSWLTNFIWRHEGILLREREINQILLVLAGASHENTSASITDPALLELVESQPVIVAMLEYGGFKKLSVREFTMEELWDELHTFATERDLLKRKGNSFPGGANVLSKVLKKYAGVLLRLGLKITIRRSNGARVVIERLDDSANQPSAKSSADKPKRTTDLQTQDGNSTLLAELQQRQRKVQLQKPTGD
jgi:hypothetical protein